MEYGVYEYVIQPREVDMTKRATIQALGDYILHVAGEDADRNGFGIRSLETNNWTWVLSRMAVEIMRLPDEYEHFSVKTWVNEIGKLMTVRNFIVSDSCGEVIAYAVTMWAMMDLTTRRALDLSSNLDYMKAVIDCPSPMERPVRIGRVDGQNVLKHRVAYSDVDFNQHANSMKYLQWMLDTMPLEKLTGKPPRRLDINFTHETRYGEEVTIMAHSCDASDCFEVLHSDGVAACKTEIKW